MDKSIIEGHHDAALPIYLDNPAQGIVPESERTPQVLIPLEMLHSLIYLLFVDLRFTTLLDIKD